MADTVNPLLGLLGSESRPGLMSQLKVSAIMGIKEALGVETDTDVKNNPARAENQQIFDEFSKLVLQQQNLLLDATKEQTDIFKKLDTTIGQLKTANKEDSVKLRKSIDDLAKKLKQTPDTPARRKIERAVTPKATAAPKSPASKETTPRAEVKPKSTAVSATAFAFPTPAAVNAPLYEDAGLIGSESEGDRVQSGEREADMASILGFLGSMFGGGDGAGPMMPWIPNRGTPGQPGKPGATRSKPGGPVLDKNGRYRDPKSGRYTKAPEPKTGNKWWEKIKGMGSKAKPAAGVFEAAGMARFMGLTGLFMPSELGNSDLYSPDDLARMNPKAESPDLASLEAEHKQIEKEMYNLVTTPTTSDDQRKAADARINELNRAAAENVRKQNALRNKTAPAPANKPDSKVIDQSLQNRDLQSQQQPLAPVVINNQQVAGNKNPPAYIAPSLETRPKESALDRYINRQTVY